ncbi:ImmA/IrrE family metallo-endopeptidase [Nostoc sp. FACHB-280]|nr:ImmA/IrrE family metallo-endopeptidase [Nostoc sp. FACHB-280]
MPALFRRVRESPGIDSLVKARDEQITKLQKENAELKAKLEKLQKQLTLFNPYIIYSKEEIESRADEILQNIKYLHNNHINVPINVERICDYLDLSIDIVDILPDEYGLIAAKILPLERKILINSGMPEMLGAFTDSTIAHEIGHWVLHINKEDVAILSEDINVNSNEQKKDISFFCRSVNIPINKSEAVEWQAQYFANCLLMPRYVLQKLCNGRDLTKWSHLYVIKDELGVTISSLIHRLQNLGWIYIPKGSKKIFLGDRESESQQIKYWL